VVLLAWEFSAYCKREASAILLAWRNREIASHLDLAKRPVSPLDSAMGIEGAFLW
jgi:hypothetical protein